MNDANDAIVPVHHGMPVLLRPQDYDRWLRGSFEELVDFQARRFPDELIEIERTSELWAGTSEAVQQQAMLL